MLSVLVAEVGVGLLLHLAQTLGRNPFKGDNILFEMGSLYELFRMWFRGFCTLGLLIGMLLSFDLGQGVKKIDEWLGGRRVAGAAAGGVPLIPVPHEIDQPAARAAEVPIEEGEGEEVRDVNPDHVDVRILQEANREMETERNEKDGLSVWMLLIHLSAKQFIQSMFEGRWDADQIIRLENLWDQLVWPLFRDIVLYEITGLMIGMWHIMRCVINIRI